ncbi:MAG: hypothetical protein RL240_3737 [Planctomycetota bacterium]|jgi:hypothetical protein
MLDRSPRLSVLKLGSRVGGDSVNIGVLSINTRTNLAEMNQTQDSNESQIIGVVFMWIGSALIASDMALGTWFTAGAMIVVPALSAIWVFVLSLWRFRFGYLAAGLCSALLPLIGFIANGCRV